MKEKTLFHLLTSLFNYDCLAQRLHSELICCLKMTKQYQNHQSFLCIIVD